MTTEEKATLAIYGLPEFRCDLPLATRAIGRISGEMGNIGRTAANLGPALAVSIQRVCMFTDAISMT